MVQGLPRNNGLPFHLTHISDFFTAAGQGMRGMGRGVDDHFGRPRFDTIITHSQSNLVMKKWHVRLLLLRPTGVLRYGFIAFTQTPRARAPRRRGRVAVQTPGHLYMFCAAPRLRCMPPL